MRSGTAPSASAPVDDTIRFSSISTPASGATSDPVAMMILPAFNVFAAPLAGSTSTRPGAAILPKPWTNSTSFFLNRNSMPFVRSSTTLSLRAIMAFRSMLDGARNDPVTGEAVSRLGEQFGRAQQRLRRDAAHVQAGPPPASPGPRRRPSSSELRRANRRDVPARAAADDHEVVSVVAHVQTLETAVAPPANRTLVKDRATCVADSRDIPSRARGT